MQLEVQNLSFSYAKEILHDLSFSLKEASFTALLGINGSGKSTLLKNISLILSPSRGYIYLDGKNIKDFNRRQISQSMAFVAQNEKPTRIRVYDAILIGRRPYINFSPTAHDHEIVSEIMDYLNLNDFTLKYIDELSGGELQKILLARALAQEPKLLLLDEPTSALDLKNQLDVMDLVQSYCRNKKIATIVSIHDLNLSLRYADNFIMLKDRKIFARGGLEIITESNLSELYSVDIKIFHQDDCMFVIPGKLGKPRPQEEFLGKSEHLPTANGNSSENNDGNNANDENTDSMNNK